MKECKPENKQNIPDKSHKLRFKDYYEENI